MAARTNPLIKTIHDEYEAGLTEKAPWNIHWQTVAEYLYQRKQFFTREFMPGDFLDGEIFNSDGPKALERMAAGLLGYTWTKKGKTPILEVSDPDFKDDAPTVEWFRGNTTILQDALDDPEAGMYSALDEAVTDGGAFGTLCVYVEEGKKTDFMFQSWTVSDFVINESDDGMVDSVIYTYGFTAHQCFTKFCTSERDLNLLPAPIVTAYKKGDQKTRFRIIYAVKPRIKRNSKNSDNLNMPYMAVYYWEQDKTRIIKESGFHEKPAIVARMAKICKEKYGRSPGMRALPEVMQMNAAWEMIFAAAEKNLDPPLAVWDDGKLGVSTIDTSPRATNVVNVSGSMTNQRPIEPLFTVGDMSSMEWVTEKLLNSINDHFYIDRLLNLNNETQMTAREALIRNALRHSLLGSLTARLYSELFTPLLERCFNIQYRKGRYGYPPGDAKLLQLQKKYPNRNFREIPEPVLESAGSDTRIYRIRYDNQAELDSKAAQATAIIDTWNFAGQISQFDKRAILKLDAVKSVDKVASALGADMDIFLEDKEYKKILKASEEQTQTANTLAAAEQAGGVAKDLSQANKADVDSRVAAASV